MIATHDNDNGEDMAADIGVVDQGACFGKERLGHVLQSLIFA